MPVLFQAGEFIAGIIECRNGVCIFNTLCAAFRHIPTSLGQLNNKGIKITNCLIDILCFHGRTPVILLERLGEAFRCLVSIVESCIQYFVIVLQVNCGA